MGSVPAPTGDELLKILGALGNPHRMRIVAALADGRNYVSRLARDLGISRPLLHMHLQRLEAAGLVVGSLELSEDGKAMKFFEVAPFTYQLTPEAITAAATTLTDSAAAPDPKPEPDPPAEPGSGTGSGSGSAAGGAPRRKRRTPPTPASSDARRPDPAPRAPAP